MGGEERLYSPENCWSWVRAGGGLNVEFSTEEVLEHVDAALNWDGDCYQPTELDPEGFLPRLDHWLKRELDAQAERDMVNHPPHYGGNPEGIECIQVTRHMNFNRGNAVKYIWRAGRKGSELEDLRKARFYIDDEIKRLEST